MVGQIEISSARALLPDHQGSLAIRNLLHLHIFGKILAAYCARSISKARQRDARRGARPESIRPERSCPAGHHADTRRVMTDRPINFSQPAIRALLASRKTRTCRLASSTFAHCRPGDRLWVRESFASASGRNGDWARPSVADYVLFRDGKLRFRGGPGYDVALDKFYWRATWSPAILMPRWASRSTLIIEDVQLRLLHDMARAEAIREGPLGLPFSRGPLWLWPGEPGLPDISPVQAVRSSWKKAHGTAGERWEDNPEVVALTFRLQIATPGGQGSGR